MKTQQKSRETEHILAEKEICYITEWKQWKELWDKESRAEVLHSLLHFGFGVAINDHDEATDRICLYLDIADMRHESFRPFQDASNRELFPRSAFGYELRNTEDLCKTLVQKAYQMLSQNFFKNTVEEDYRAPSWLQLAAHPQVLAKLFWFFRIDNDGNIPNLFSSGSEHYIEIAKDFALNFCLFAWDCDGGSYSTIRGVSEEVKKIFRQVRLDTITVLFGLEKLDILLNRYRREKIDKKCMEKLEGIVMDHKLYLPRMGLYGEEYRKPHTGEEACLRSRAAQVLLILRTQLAEQKRFDEMRKLEKQRREAEAKLNSLKS